MKLFLEHGSNIGPWTDASAGVPRDILLLQGPIGPFFNRLQDELERGGATVTRVLFNAGDDLHGPRRNHVRFSGTADEWETWLRARIEHSPPDLIVYFGCKRPAHRIAALLAREYGIEVRSVEEGYVRPGYITCEAWGNNNLSPLKGQLPAGEHYAAPAKLNLGSGFMALNWWGTSYYLWRSWFSRDSDRALFHREMLGPWKDTLLWNGHRLKTIFMRFPETTAIARLRREFDRNYVFVPLQTPGDSQMGDAANGWTLERLIEGALAGFAKQNAVARIVFKLHPLDIFAKQRIAFIAREAARLGVGERVVVLHTGSIDRLAAHSDGMIIVNSCSGLAAIKHGVPLLMLGDGVFRNDQLVTCGTDEACIDAFFAERRTAPAELRTSYLDFLAANALIPGDFYQRKGIAAGARNLARRLLETA